MPFGTIATLASLAISAAINTASTVQANKKGAQQRQMLNESKQEATQTAQGQFYKNEQTAQGAVENARRAAENANNAKDNANVSGNRTAAETLASKKATNETTANVMNNAMAAANNRDNTATERAETRRQALDVEGRKLKEQEAQNWMNLGAGLTSAAAGAASTMIGTGAGDAARATSDTVNATAETENGLANNLNNHVNGTANPSTYEGPSNNPLGDNNPIIEQAQKQSKQDLFDVAPASDEIGTDAGEGLAEQTLPRKYKINAWEKTF